MRFGGEEFLLVLAQTDLEGALYVAERLRAEIASNPTTDTSSGSIPTTASFGVLAVDFSVAAAVDVTEKSLIAAADALLYEAKMCGRNSIRCREWSGESAGPVVGSLPLAIYDSGASEGYRSHVG